MNATTQPTMPTLPRELEPLFWDHEFKSLSWRRHREFITGRVLAAGTWDAIRWLRRSLGDVGIRRWIERRRGRGLSPQQLRFWELVLALPSEEVDAWLAARSGDPWDRRREP